MPKQRGLPQERKMRHDSHFVDEITAQRSPSIGRLVEVDRIEPNPHQPRKHFGDLSEMVSSVKEKGILEPILVRTLGDKFQIIAGERRYQAAKIAGLKMLPCIEVDVDTRGMLEISLIENLQRKDLSPFEEAAAIQRLCDQFRYTHEEIARKLGKSRPVITEALSLNRMPEEIQDRCRRADINSKSMLLQIVRQNSVDDMHRLLDKIGDEGYTREDARQFNRTRATTAPRRSRNYTYRYRPDSKEYQFRLTFNRAEVDRTELIRALQDVLRQLTENPEPEGTEASKKHGGRGARRAERGQPSAESLH